MLDDFRLIHRFRLIFADVDMLRHANNLAYARWAETLRTDYFADVLGETIGGNRGIILARTEIVYAKSLTYREHVAVGGRVTKIGTKSFEFVFEAWSADREELCATVACTLVAFDYVRNATIAVPEAWRSKIAAFEAPKAVPSA